VAISSFGSIQIFTTSPINMLYTKHLKYIVQEWLLKDIGLYEGDELDLAAKAVLEVYICARRNCNQSLLFYVEGLPEIKANVNFSTPFTFSAEN
jgi:hypothetical protein